jgi:undecaprenyl-diphosphatase
MNDYITAIFLGIVEGLTEFIPVSSTGHLILATELSGADPNEWAMFNVVIQLGAILAVVYQYWGTFWSAGIGVLKREREGLMFARNILLGFLPSAVIGFALYESFEAMLGNPGIVPWALIAGGVAIIVIERAANPRDEGRGVAELPLAKVLGVGFAQCLAMVPGVSRSGATIMGALAMGINRKTAAEFSFFLAVPTMLGAATVKILDEPALLAGEAAVGWTEIGLGFVAAFLVAMVVIRAFVAYVSRSGFTPFAWYRIIAGSAALAWLTFA